MPPKETLSREVEAEQILPPPETTAIDVGFVAISPEFQYSHYIDPQQATVHLSTEYIENTPAEHIPSPGLLDMDSLDHVWRYLSSFAQYGDSINDYEEILLRMLGKFQAFIEDEDNFKQCVNDHRLEGIFRLNAAVEQAQFGDYESSSKEIAAVEDEAMRQFLTKALHDATESISPGIDENNSRANLVQFSGLIEANELPSSIKTKVVSNHSLETFSKLFDPFSGGRVHASVFGVDSRNRRKIPSSKDSSERRMAEDTLGHKRRLFTPRIIYGIVATEDQLQSGNDSGWDYGPVRFVIKEDSLPVQEATFTLGDSMNGTKLQVNRQLNRHDAGLASNLLHTRKNQSGYNEPIYYGSQESYIEAQLPGLRIPDIEAIVINPGLRDPKTTQEIVAIGEVAARHGIEVSYAFDWDKIRSAYPRVNEEVLYEELSERILQLQKSAPGVQFQIFSKRETKTEQLQS